MKAELDIDIQELVKEIAQEVIRVLKPLLAKNPSGDYTILDIKGLADYLRVTHRWVYDRIRLKEIPYYKVGRFPRFRKQEIDRWLESNKIPAFESPTRPLRVVK